MSLSAEEVQQFVQQGYTVLRSAFRREVAFACRDVMWQKLEEVGIYRDQPATWVRRKGFDLCFSKEEKPWDEVITSRLTGALDQICGSGQWNAFSIGWWVVSFPGQLEGPPGVDGHWHVDGAHYQHFLFSPEIGVVLLMYFSDVADDTGGGTAVAVGSHQNVVHSLADAGVKGLTSRQVSNAAIAAGVDPTVATSGQAGDVIIIHPFMLHARTKNLADVNPDGVRFLCHPCISLKEHMQLQRDDPEMYSPLELSIRRVLDKRERTGIWDRSSIDREACERYLERKAADAKEQQTVFMPEMPNSQLADMLGFSSFGKKRRKTVKMSACSKRQALAS